MQSLNSYVAARQLEDAYALASMKRAARRVVAKGSDKPRHRPRFRLRAA